MDDIKTPEISRRGFLSAGAVGTAAGLAPIPAEAQAPVPPDQTNPRRQEITLNINGQERQLTVDTRTSLLDAFREQLGLSGSKKGCDMGQCGACTILVDGTRTLSCLTLAVAYQGRKITTIEGLANGDDLHPMQQAFIDNDAFQCGYCTPGQIVSAVGCVREGHARTDAEIREYMSGNLCRCAAYPNIVAAINQAKSRMGRG